MKNLSILFVLVFTIFACQPKTESPVVDKPTEQVETKKGPKAYITSSTDEISLDTFNIWRARWERDFRSYFNSDSLHYFNMPIVDLTTITSNPKADGARLYMGMGYDSLGNEMPHIMITATEGGVADMKMILDYSKPCPAYCN